jgi:hypothetical protein
MRPPATITYPYLEPHQLQDVYPDHWTTGSFQGHTVLLGQNTAIFLKTLFTLPPIGDSKAKITERFFTHGTRLASLEAPDWRDLADKRPTLWRFGIPRRPKLVGIGRDMRLIDLRVLQLISRFPRPEIMVNPPAGSPFYFRFRGGSAVSVCHLSSTSRTPAYSLFHPRSEP